MIRFATRHMTFFKVICAAILFLPAVGWARDGAPKNDSPPMAGNSADQLADLVKRRKETPDDKELERQIEAALAHSLPDIISSDVLTALPLDLTSGNGGSSTLAVPKPFVVTEAVEPRYDWRFGKVCYFYQRDNFQDGKLRLFCAVHYTRQSDTKFAMRTANLLAVTHGVLVDRLKHGAANGDAPFDVWLCPKGKTGGEQYRSNLYFYDLDTPRSSIEWIREIVHEYSHLAIAPIGGYRSPEYWANGYLGERLLIRWLYKSPEARAAVESAWGDFSGGANYIRLLVDPASALYRRVGPNARWLSRRDEDGMRYFIGLILVADDKYGAGTIGDALAGLPTYKNATPEDLVESLGEAAGQASHPVPAKRPITARRRQAQ